MAQWRVPVGVIWIFLAVYQGVSSLLHGTTSLVPSAIICGAAGVCLVFDFWKAYGFVIAIGVISAVWAAVDLATIGFGDASLIRNRELFLVMRTLEMVVAILAAVVAYRERP